MVSWQGVFKLSISDGEEMYFQSAGPEDRDGWAHAIGAVIRSLSSATQVRQGLWAAGSVGSALPVASTVPWVR